MNITILQLHKRDSGEYKYIQDKYAINSSNNTFALADGTTQSFKSEIWAELLTSSFVNNPSFETQELISNFTSYVEGFKNVEFEFDSNPAKASLEKAKLLKGGTATFIGVQFTNDKTMDAISIGDSNLFILNINNNQLESFPFSDLESLDNNNYFLNTEQLIKGDIDESFFRKKTFEVHTGQKIILATDALSRLILQKPNTIHELIQLSDFESLHKFCLKYWESKELQEDDISALIIDVENSTSIKSIHPPNDFSFPKANEEEFIPSPIIQHTSTKFTDMQMQEIRNQFNGVANDFIVVKRKIKLLIVLLVSTVGLLVMCLLFIFWFRSGKEPQTKQRKADKITITELEKKNSSLESEIKALKKKIKIPTSIDREPTKLQKDDEPIKEEKISLEVAKERQQELRSAGYNKIIVDGIWGEDSKQTWEKYQKTKRQ